MAWTIHFTYRVSSSCRPYLNKQGCFPSKGELKIGGDRKIKQIENPQTLGDIKVPRGDRGRNTAPPIDEHHILKSTSNTHWDGGDNISTNAFLPIDERHTLDPTCNTRQDRADDGSKIYGQCDLCEKISFKPFNELGLAFRGSYNEEIIQKYAYGDWKFYLHHFSLQDLLQSSCKGCSLCTFLLSRLRDWTPNGKKDDDLFRSLALVKTHIVLSQTSPAYGTADVFEKYRKHAKLPINPFSQISVHCHNYSAQIELTHLPRILEKALLMVPPHGLDKPLEEDEDGLAMTLELATGWLQICQEGHRMCMPYMNEQPILPSRIIYIDPDENKTPYLYESKGNRGNYVALSYRWGMTQKGELKGSVYHDYKHAIPMESISRTPRDAIRITRGLGIRYLWVDALCIVQDSDVDKGKELAVMGDIYQNATVTIAAANGDHADSGLFQIRDVRAYRPCPIFMYEDEDGREVRVFAARPDFDVQSSPLDTRAWTFQEEILSTRILKFGPDCLRWSCVTLAASEKAPMGNRHSPNRLDYQMREWIHYPESKPLWYEAMNPRRRYFEDWYSVVEHYSLRDLTNPTDKLPALSGLSGIMQKLHGYTYLAGLWKEDLEYGLLWYVCQKPERHRAGDISQDSLYYKVSYIIGQLSGSDDGTSSLESDSGNPKGNNGFPAKSMLWLHSQEKSLTKAYIYETPSMDDSIDGLSHVGRTPSWSWAHFDDAGIRFLYSQHSLAASGMSMATGLEAVCRPKHYNQSVHGEVSGGYITLKGALDWVFVLSNEINGWHKDYQTPSIICSRWTAHLLGAADICNGPVGFAALDDDPEDTNLEGTMIACLLLQFDDEETQESKLPTQSSWLRPDSYLPLAVSNMSQDRVLLNNGRRRWVVCLLLDPVNNEKTIFRRVGLCQMYHLFWADRLEDSEKRQTVVTIV